MGIFFAGRFVRASTGTAIKLPRRVKSVTKKSVRLIYVFSIPQKTPLYYCDILRVVRY